MLTHLQSDEVTEIIGVLKEFDQQENLVDIDINVTNTIVAPLSATLDTLATNIAREIPNIDADDMRRIVVSQIFQLDAVQNFNIALAEKLTPVADELNKLSLVVFNGFDRSITNMLAKVNDKVNEALSSVTSTLDEIPLSAASMDGYGVFYGDSLAKVHVASSFSITGNEKENSFGFSAALDIVNEAISDESGCSSTSVEKANLRATVSTRDIAMPLGEKELKVDLLLLGVTISGDGEVKGVFGAITSKSGFGYDTFSLYDLGLATGIGEEETYLGAKASARMDSVQLGVSFLVGQVCNRMIVASIIPKAINEFITIPNNRFNGALVFGEGQMPIYTNGCTLTVIARAKVGTWFLFGPPKTFGGIVGGGAFGKALCIATLGGEVEVLAEKSGDVVRFKGSGWGAAGVGSCDSSWSSVSDSRSDSWCGTGDARFGASYDNGWSLEKIRTSAVH
jgi:small nuclear ribonucleoprotein (snRNP)-like protein